MKSFDLNSIKVTTQINSLTFFKKRTTGGREPHLKILYSFIEKVETNFIKLYGNQPAYEEFYFGDRHFLIGSYILKNVSYEI